MQWRSDIKALWLLFNKWLPGFHRGSLVLIAFFPQILWLRGGDCYAPLLTRRGGGKFQGADLGMFLSDKVNQVLCLCLFRLSVEARVQHSKN